MIISVNCVSKKLFDHNVKRVTDGKRVADVKRVEDVNRVKDVQIQS